MCMLIAATPTRVFAAPGRALTGAKDRSATSDTNSNRPEDS